MRVAVGIDVSSDWNAMKAGLTALVGKVDAVERVVGVGVKLPR